MTDTPTVSRMQEIIAIIKKGMEDEGFDFTVDWHWADLIKRGALTAEELEWCQTFCIVLPNMAITVGQ